MKSFISYLGGKSLLTKTITPLIPEHRCYCEVFAGASWMLFAKEESKVEIINDTNQDLVTLYRVVKYHLDEFVRYFRWALISRDEFERLKKEAPETLTDIQRAARFYYLLKAGFASRIHNPALSISPSRASNLNLLRIEEELSQAHLRLARVFIENRHYSKVITRFDRSDTFFYLDPPYWDCEDYYGKGIFSKEDFEALRDLLKSIQGKFILSINNVPAIRELFKEFHIKEVKTKYVTKGNHRPKPVTELLILNT